MSHTTSFSGPYITSNVIGSPFVYVHQDSACKGQQSRRRRICPDIAPDPFILPKDIDPKGIINLRSIGNFVLRVHEAQTQNGAKYPTPVLAAIPNAPHVRRMFGHVLAADILYLDSRLPNTDAPGPLTKAESLTQGREAMESLAVYRFGEDKAILASKRLEYPAPDMRDPNEPQLIQVGRHVVELIENNYTLAGPIARDALLALQVHQDAQIAEAA